VVKRSGTPKLLYIASRFSATAVPTMAGLTIEPLTGCIGDEDAWDWRALRIFLGAYMKAQEPKGKK
jgi:hypothetical protein